MIPEAHLQAACCDLVSEVVRISGKGQLRAMGGSMLPTLWPGDLLTVRRLEPHELRAGQVVLYHRDGRLTAHRILRISGGVIYTRGDSLPLCDPPVNAGEVIGQVESILRNGRRLDPTPTFWQRITAWLLRRSARFTWFFVRLASRLRGTFFRGSALAEATPVY
jgi:signal peptidase I